MVAMDHSVPLHPLPSRRLAPGRDDGYERLMRQVMEANPDVQDTMDVAAVIESTGWTDQRVESAFGYASVFELAEQMYLDIKRSVGSQPIPPKVEIPLSVLLVQTIRQVLHGFTFALPMAVSVLSMILLHISVASYLYFSVYQATALALATFLSFIATGGFSQAMANTYYLLVGLQETSMVERTMYLIMRWGFVFSVVVAVTVLLLDTIFPLMPISLVLFMGIYTVMLSMLWLSFSGLYVLRREYILTLVTALAILIAYLMWTHGFPVVVAQVVGIFTATVVTVVVSIVILRKSLIGTKDGGRIIKTRMSQLAYTTWPYFIYGILYFVFIFADRLIAWSTNTVFLPYDIWFRGQYELGMDWALAALIVPLAAAEAMINYVMRRMQTDEHEIGQQDVVVLTARMRRVYMTGVAIFLGVAVLGWAAAHVMLLLVLHLPGMQNAIPVRGVEPFVLAWASWAYVFLAICLFNILLLFTLSQPIPALRAMMTAVAIDLVVGLVATRVFAAYQFAVIGLAVGVAYLLVASSAEVWRTLSRIDYMLFRIA
jgi:hypothetical protein